MRKLLSILVIALLFFGSFPHRGEWSFGVRAVSKNIPATMMFLNLNPVGYEHDGKVLEGDRMFPWEPKGASYWGKYFSDNESETYLMPNANNARTLAGVPYPVRNKKDRTKYTEPMYWTYVYLTVDASGGTSTAYHKWYAVVDDNGQLWLDPDGVFNDCRTDVTADPSHPQYVSERCVVSPLARMDPSMSNNTQGPYRITQGGGYRDKIYFWDRNTSYKKGTDRAFRVGWFELNYYYDQNSIVAYGDEEFFLNIADPYNPVIVSEPTIRFSSQYRFYDSNFNGQYDSDEPIYLKGTGNTLNQVEVDDFRYTFVSVIHENKVYNYRASASTTVKDFEKDFGKTLLPFTYTSPNFEIRFIDKNGNGQYNINEPIYHDIPYTHTATNQFFPIGYATPADVRLTTNRRAALAHEPVMALSLLEVLQAQCDDSRYDITVLADVWKGKNTPSTTAARLRSPNGDIKENALRIQKSTVLGPDPDDFIVPGCTFHDIRIDYRSYVGIQIFNDNGFDNNRGANLPYDAVLPQSLSDEYKAQRTGEEYLGANNTAVGLNYLDFGQQLSLFPNYVMYYDSRFDNPPSQYAPHLGCSEPIYQKKDKNPSNPFVAEGDIRLTDVIVDRGGNQIEYSAGSIVTPGDADIGWRLHPMYSDNDENGQPYLDDQGSPVRMQWKFADGFQFNQLFTDVVDQKYIKNQEYDVGEMIYFDLNRDNIFNIGDVRLTSGTFSNVPVECGSILDFAQETWYHEYPARMVSMGLNGDPRYIDIEVLPGQLPVEVSFDPPLKVEQTSKVKISLGRPFAKDEKVYVSIRGPKPGEVEGADERPFAVAAEASLDGFEPPDRDNGYLNPPGWAISGNNQLNGWSYGDNIRSSAIALWGSGPDGFKVGNTVFSHMYLCEDGMMALVPSRQNNDWMLLYQYRYEDYVQYGYPYQGGRPYPYSYAGFAGWSQPPQKCYNNWPQPSFNRYNTNSYYYGQNWIIQPGYVQAEKMFQKNLAWIMPLGGQWHVPGGPSLYSQYGYPPSYYGYVLKDPDQPLFPYGVYYKKTNDYVRVVWKVVTWPFQNGEWNWNEPFHSASGFATPLIRQWTSEFDVILYRDGTITFNYNKVRIPSRRFRMIDNDNAPFDLDHTNWVDTDPGNCNPNTWTGRPYLPYIGIVNGIEGARAFSHRSYQYSATPNSRSFDSPEGLTIGWILPEDPDQDIANARIFEDVVVLDKDNPTYEFEHTPYRGSVHDGFHGEDGYLAGTSLFNQFEIRVYSERGGVIRPLPTDSDFTGSYTTNYIDPFWKRAVFNKAEWQNNYRKEPFFIIPVEPVNNLPDHIRDRYDCFAFLKYDIAPEDIDIIPSKTCLDMVSSRQPIFSYKVLNANNPNDVNDPHNTEMVSPKWYAGNGTTPDPDGSYNWGIPLSGQGRYGKPTLMNYNVHGAGIDHLFTAQLVGGGVFRRYIVQVNSNGTADAWRWFEADLPGQVFGALDQHDMLYSIRSQRISYQGRFDPLNGNGDPTNYWYKVPDPFNGGTGFTDTDCSDHILDLMHNLIEDDYGFPSLGFITAQDKFGMFSGNPSNTDRAANMPENNNTQLSNAYLSPILTFGVPVAIMSPEDDFNGGVGLGVANPKNADSPLTIRLYSTNLIFDYNSSNQHPTDYVWDKGPGIDYLGYKQIKVVPTDPVLNFAEMTIVDRSLQLSRENYTAGSNPWSKLPPPNPQIKAHYDPILKDWAEFRSYSGGQTHTGRALPLDPSIPHQGSGRNAYPAIQSKQFYKLGTEFFPMTDYGVFFALRDLGRNHYTYDPLLVVPESLQLQRVIVRGPFMFPKIFSEPDAKIDTSYRYEGIENVPVQYDTSGEIIIDSTNSPLWAMAGSGYNQSINLGRSLPVGISSANKNKYARYTHSLYYGTLGGAGAVDPRTGGGNASYGMFFEGDTIRPGGGQGQLAAWFTNAAFTGYNFWSPSATYLNPFYLDTVPEAFNNRGVPVFVLDELIPTGPGKIEIMVETSDGTIKNYQDCCQENAPIGITVEGLEITDYPKEFVVDQDNRIDLTLREYDRKGDQDHPTALPVSNNALMVVWQDRGVINPMTGDLLGAGDGWLTNPPRSSDFTNIGKMYLPSDDLNRDGKISFNDWETEILGSYDLASNTWTSGLIDARTFQRGNGKYRMEFSAQNKSLIDTIGLDFGGLNLRQKNTITPPDGVVSDDEVLPIIINAYKFGDDNNDRGFTPLYNLPGRFPEFSHEVYLTGRVEIPVKSQAVLSVTTIPDVLTAGVQPELQDPSEPLTFVVTDEAGAPVDLMEIARRNITNLSYEDIDIVALERALWNGLFKDPHPNPLPQYYWTRTDLHNDDGTPICNTYMFSNQAGRFEPIKFDADQGKAGKYVFKGFTANDAGSFDVFVYTPDRRKMGIANVKVQLPEVSYQISNYDDAGKSYHASPGEPDFVMTAGDNNIYHVRVQVNDAQGRKLTGVGKSVSICGGGNLEISRFTPFITTHKNYYRAITPFYWHYYGSGQATWRRSSYYTGSFSKYLMMPTYWGNRWNAHIAIDTNNNGKIDLINDEIMRTQTFYSVVAYTTMYGSYGFSQTLGRNYYNTENVKYDNNTFAINPMYDTNSKLNPDPGWGFGAIYNRPYYSKDNYGMVFANIDRLGNNSIYNQWETVSHRDSLNLDVNGETAFYVFGEDVFEVGGLVGKNNWSVSSWADVAGAPYSFMPSSPNKVTTRYGRQIVLPASYRGRVAYATAADYTYRLDWDGMPSHVAKVSPPRVEALEAETLQPLGKAFMDEMAYDLIYGKDNHIHFNLFAADPRDLPIKSDMQLILAGNNSEYRVTGRLQQQGSEPGDPSSTTMMITPTGTGLTTISLDTVSKNSLKDLMSSTRNPRAEDAPLPEYYYMLDLLKFDTAKGLKVQVQTLSGPLAINKKNNIKVLITEIGSQKVLEGVNVTLSGAGIQESKTTNADGVCFFDSLTPTTQEPIVVLAKKQGYIDGRDVLDIGTNSGRKQDWIHVNSTNPRTNKPVQEISGTVEDHVVKMTINKTLIPIQADRTFKASITLKEGQNTILIEMEDNEGRVSRKILSIELKTQGPSLILDNYLKTEKFIELEHIDVMGTVEPGSQVWINQQEAQVEGNRFNLKVSVKKGSNQLNIIAKDDLSNETRLTQEIYIFALRKIEFIIGSNIARIDGQAVSMEQAPFVEYGRTYVPLRIVSEQFGAQVNWNQDTRSISLVKGDTRIYMTIDSYKAVINDRTIDLDAPPLLRNGRTFVPVRFVSEWLGGKVEWNERIKMILIEFLL